MVETPTPTGSCTLPLTAGQRGLWFAQQLNPDSAVFNIGQYFHVPGHLDAELLQRAITTMCAETDALRVRFVPTGEGTTAEAAEVSQQLDPDAGQTIQVIDLAAAEDPERSVQEWMRQDMRTPRDPAGEDLFTIALLRTRDGDVFYQRVHHMLMDGYAAMLVMYRLAELYTAAVEGREAEPCPFGSLRDLLADEQRYEASERQQQDERHWAERLAELPEPASLSEADESLGAYVIRRTGWLPAASHHRLQKAARRHGRSWTTAVSAATAALTHRLTGAAEPVIGLPVTARDNQPLRTTPSMVSNVLPLRMPVRPGSTGGDLLDRASSVTREALKHQRHRTERMRQQAGLTGHGQRLTGPSVNIMPFHPTVRFGPFTVSADNLSIGPVDDVSIIVYGTDINEPLRVDFDANPRRYTEQELDEHLRHFLNLLEGMAEDMDRPVAQLQMLDDTERVRLLQLAATDDPVAQGPATVVTRFEEQAARTPHATAVTDENGRRTFADLDARANQLAGLLGERGAGRGSTVAVALGRSRGAVEAMLAVLKAGAAYQPIESSHPRERIATVLADSAPAWVLTDSALAARLPEDAPLMLLDEPATVSQLVSQPVALHEHPAVGQQAGPADPAYLIHTSGSTGKPKGVLVSHGALANLFSHHNESLYGPVAGAETLRVAHTAALSFDAAWDPLLWMVAGHELHVVSDQVRRDPEATAAYILEHRINAIETTPSHVRQLLAVGIGESAISQGASPHEGSPLRVIALGGEEIDRALWDQLRSNSGTTVVNLYGPTEACIDAVVADLAEHAEPVIGNPVAGARAYVLDSGLCPTPAGTRGELYLGGRGLAMGYLNRPGQTATAFVPDPYGAPGERLYRTGDLARWNRHGALEFLGRADHQVKLRGFRVEPAEISAALVAHPELAQATVVLSGRRSNERGSNPSNGATEKLVAYVVAYDGAKAPDSSTLAAWLRGRVPEYMVPTTFVCLPTLPLTTHGKVDTSALPEPEPAAAAGREPTGATERMVCAVFADVLDLAEVGAEQDFFALGGHSLTATQAVSALRGSMQRELSVRDLFAASTPERLAAVLDERAPESQRPQLRAGHEQRRAAGEPLPLAPVQRGLWLVNQLNPDDANYNLPLVLRLDGDLDIAALRAALGDLVRRHEPLRTLLRESEGRPWQQVLPAERAVPEVPLAELDVSAPHNADTQLAAAIEPIVQRGFQLDAEFPLRARLFRLSDGAHVLLLVLHHTAADGWSLAPLARDLSTAYTARCAGQAPEFAALPVSYGDYSVWQHELLGDSGDGHSRAAEQLDYWRRQLAGSPEELSLPTDRGRPERMRAAGTQLPVRFDQESVAAIRGLAAEYGVSVFMVLHAAFATLLRRFGAGTDLPIGAPTAGRDDEQLTGLVGYLVNTVVLRADLSGQPSFAEVLQRVRETDLAAFAHAELPFDKVVEALQPQRAANRNPLFQVMLSWQNTPAVDTGLGDLEVSQRSDALPQSPAKFDMLLDLGERDGGIDGSLTLAADLFDRATGQRLLEGLQRLVRGAAEDPHRPIGELELHSATQRRQLLQTWPDGGHGTGGNVLEEFDRQVAEQPSAVAVDDGTVRRSYAELAGRSRQVARELAAHGVGRGAVVSVAMPRGADWLAAMLGVLRSGACYQPIDTTHPHARLRSVLGDAEPALVLVSGNDVEHVRQLCGELELAVLVVDDPRAATTLDGRSSAPLTGGELPQLDDGDPAYLIHTSGSTGTPKGVQVPHRALANLLAHQQSTLMRPQAGEPGTRLRVALSAAITFDASWDPVLWMLAGHELHVLDDATRSEVDTLVDYLSEQRIDVIESTPSHVAALDAAGLFAESAQQRHYPGLIALGGEPVDAQLWTRLRELAGVRAVNLYGPTEACVDTVWAELSATESPVLGRPIAGVRAYVLDETRRVVPAGVAGELYLGGQAVALGYLHRQEETATAFVPDPFSASQERLYRTGDIVRWNAEGQLEFLGRADDQIKLRGLRIEPGEVSAGLRQHPAVSQAVTVLLGAGSAQRLTSYLLTVEGRALPESEELRQHLATVVPSYMIPAAFVEIAELPLTAHGKLDIAALPAPGDTAAGTSAGPAPRTETERVLAEQFCDLLDVDQPGVYADFFALGGHSLLASQLAGRVRSELGIELAVRAVFENPTIAGLAEQVERAERSGSALRPMPHPARVPLSHAQQRLWFLNQLASDSGAAGYTIPIALRLHGDLDIPALRSALRELVRRHEPLRTVFGEDDDGPWQQVLDPDRAAPALRLDRASPAELPAVLAAEAGESFDLRSDVPLRARLFQVGPASEQQYVLLLVLHHIATDGWSAAPLGRDIAELYAAAHEGRASTLQPLPVSYRDYSLWQREQLGDESDPGSMLARQLDYWSQQLAGMPEETPLPRDRSRRRATEHRAGSVELDIDEPLRERLAELAVARGASLFMLLQSALAALLSRYGAGTDIPIGAPVAGRSDRNLEELVGFFANTLVLRTDTSGDPSFVELLDRVRETDLNAYAAAEVPFDRLVEALEPARSLDRHPLFQVMLTLDNTPPARLQLPGVDTELEPVTAPDAKFDLSVNLADDGQRLSGTLDYAAELFDAATAAELAEGLVAVLRLALQAPQRPLGDLELLSSRQRSRLLQHGAGEELGSDGPDTVIERFEDEVRRSSADTGVAGVGAPALVWKDTRWSLTELDEHANRLARALLARGVTRGSRVAVALPRSARSIVALLATMKTGAAYVPVDASYPTERIDYLLQDSQPDCVLTESTVTELAQRSILLDEPELEHELQGISGSPLRTDERTAPRGADVAYVLYTSGSTGRPKGVTVSHRSLAGLMAGHEQTLYAPGRRVAGKERLNVALTAALSFDAAWDPILWLLAGHQLNVVSDEVRRDPEALVELVGTEKIDVLESTPSHARQLLECGLLTGSHRPSVLALGGEAVGADLWRQLAAEPHLHAVNLYGPTEACVDAVASPITGPEPVIGSPVSGVRAYVLDEALRMVPEGATGSLYLAGSGVALGYLHRPAQTAASFLPDPFGAAGQRMYRTGDTARWNRAGKLEFLGRSDSQLKLRGFRIEPGEVEAALAEHPQISAAAVVVLGDPGASSAQRLVGYVIPAEGAEPDLDAVRAAAAKRLPDYMLPSTLLSLDRFPLTPNGKLDTTALPEPDTARTSGRAPRYPREELLCRLFAEVLDVRVIGIDDDFFDLGGHSLLATRLAGRIRSTLNVELPIRALFEAPTVALLAQQLSADGDSGAETSMDELLPLRTGGQKAPLFCVHPATGLSWPYSGLLPYLDSDQPVYGLQSPPLAGNEMPDSMQAIGARYIASIRTVQAHGPYRLLGWSFGGNLAQEIAVQLERAGEQVSLLSLVDSYPQPPDDGLETAEESEILTALMSNLGLVPEDPEQQPRTLADARQMFENIGSPLGTMSEESLGAMVTTFTAQAHCMRGFTPGSFGGDMLFFTATEGRDESTPTWRDWGQHVRGPITNHEVPTAHTQLMGRSALQVIGPVVAERLRSLDQQPQRDSAHAVDHVRGRQRRQGVLR